MLHSNKFIASSTEGLSDIDSGEDTKVKGTRKGPGVRGGKKEGRESTDHFFYDPPSPTFGTFKIIRFPAVKHLKCQ